MNEPRKSSHSNPNGACVEVGRIPGAVAVRDTTLGSASPVLLLAPAAWREFITATKGDSS